MDSDIEHYMRPQSLADLPLNIIFKVLSLLSGDDLENVGRTCTMLRTLSNESMIYRNNVKGSNGANWWTRRLVTDVFDILDTRRNFLLNMTTRHNVSVIESLRHIQKKFNLQEAPRRATRSMSHSGRIDELDMDGNIVLPKNSLYHGGDKRNFTDIISNKDAVTYKAIIEGIKTVIDKQEIAIDGSDNSSTNEQLEVTSDIHQDGSKVTSTTRTSKQPSENTSPATSNNSRTSTDSIFSDKPILTDQEWKRPQTPESPFKDALNAETLSSGSSSLSSSSDSLDKLRNSKHVRDKAALFEKLLFRENSEQSTKKQYHQDHKKRGISRSTSAWDNSLKTMSENSNTKNYGELQSNMNTTSNNSSRKSSSPTERKVSEKYIEEVENHIATPRLLPASHTMKDLDNIARNGNVASIVEAYREEIKQKKYPHKRSQLKVVISSDNKVSYERIPTIEN
ncbi:hypothetical protein RNJ44_02710 [Nakaseomyces bracarensis]|uniref:F-box domain-containing protein n=1 Tax=Nakaseomyces bracarensis TaxID=273131 RepID=A0ABR4NZZ2_9SACH